MRFGGVAQLDWQAAIGMNFFGDPFGAAGPWQEENAIGALWRRFVCFLEANPQAIADRLHTDQLIELQLETQDTSTTGDYEVFVGAIVAKLECLPYQCVAKRLGQRLHAVFTLEGDEITSDWWPRVQQQLSEAGLQISLPYSIQRYDRRYLGIDRLAESELDLLIPVTPGEVDGE